VLPIFAATSAIAFVGSLIDDNTDDQHQWHQRNTKLPPPPLQLQNTHRSLFHSSPELTPFIHLIYIPPSKTP
jgi:hypothetical protein